jgi:hypothetical protein
MNISQRGLVLFFVVAATTALAQDGNPGAIQPEAWQIVVLANQARAEAKAGPLKWDEGLAAAARAHCLRMAEEGQIAHRYGGEPDLGARAAQAGAHFSLIEENVALGPSPAAIHDEWMHSPGHRTNLLNPEVDRVGVAVVASRGVLYAVADYARGVATMTDSEVEGAVGALVRASGVTVLEDATAARAACLLDHGLPPASSGPQPGFVMRWQDTNLSHLPKALTVRLASRQFHQAAVGSCAPKDVEGAFTMHRVAVLLY